MKKLLIAITLIALASPQFASAGTNVERIDGDLYFATYQMNRMVQGGILFDTQSKNIKKMAKRLSKICGEDGFSHFHILTPVEIVKDETLKAYFDMYAGGEMNEQNIVGRDGSQRANVIKRLVYFSPDARPGYEDCGH